MNKTIKDHIKKSDLFFIVYSLTKTTSFNKVDEIKHEILKIKKYTNHQSEPIVILGNKWDL